jgi:Flp pilus assembly protein TadG
MLLQVHRAEARSPTAIIQPNTRRAATAVEFAMVAPVAFFLILATFIGGMGVFRYQEIASMAREAARYASTHGGMYAQENNQAIVNGTMPNVNKSYIVNNVVLPNGVAMDSTQVATSINFNTSNGSFDWDDTTNNGQRWPYSLQTINGTTYSETNTVSVTVSYTWFPEGLLVGPFTLSSTSVMPMSY